MRSPLLCAVLLAAASCADAPPPAPPAWTVRVLLPRWWGRDEAAGVAVTVRDPAGARRTVTTDARGEVSLPAAAPGRYGFTVAHALDEGAVFALTGHRRAVSLTAEAEIVRPPNDPAPATLRLAAPRLGGLVIREFYYAGARGTTPDAHYFSDQFVEVANNATEPVDVAGLYVADLDGPSGEINPGTRPTTFQSDPAHVYAANVWRVPDDAPRLLAPGESVVLAQDGTNHMPDSPLDLSDADWETFVERTDMRDRDHPTVPNLTRAHFTGGVDWLVTVFGPALVIFRVDDLAALERRSTPIGARVRVPVEAVLDGVEALMDADSGAFQRLPPAVSRGFVHAAGTYTGQSARRRPAAMVRGRTVWQDTGDTGADFEVIDAPSPRHGAP